MAFKSNKQRAFVKAMEHNQGFQKKPSNGFNNPQGSSPQKVSMSNLGSSIHQSMIKPIQPMGQEQAMNPSPRFTKLRSKLKY